MSRLVRVFMLYRMSHCRSRDRIICAFTANSTPRFMTSPMVRNGLVWYPSEGGSGTCNSRSLVTL